MPRGSTPESGPLARAVSEEVRVALTRRRLTVKQLAVKAGMSPSYLGKRLRDEASLSIDDLESIWLALGEDPIAVTKATLDALEANYRANLEQDKH
jgi:transcriptional regulator with XRE-family HTH domain